MKQVYIFCNSFLLSLDIFVRQLSDPCDPMNDFRQSAVVLNGHNRCAAPFWNISLTSETWF